jgi:hypothetical protein
VSRAGSEPGESEIEAGGDTGAGGETGAETRRERRAFVSYALLGPVLRGRSHRKVVDASPYARQSSGSE